MGILQLKIGSSHGLCNEFYLISEVAFDGSSLPSCLPDAGEIPPCASQKA